MTRLLVTGSREWDDIGIIWQALQKVHAYDPATVLVHGAAPRGADLLCRMAWCETLEAAEEPHLANWYPGGRFDVRAGIHRNRRMADLGAWGCLAFGVPCRKAECWGKAADPGWPFHVTHGTWHCAAYAESLGIPVKRYAAPIA